MQRSQCDPLKFQLVRFLRSDSRHRHYRKNLSQKQHFSEEQMRIMQTVRIDSRENGNGNYLASMRCVMLFHGFSFSPCYHSGMAEHFSILIDFKMEFEQQICALQMKWTYLGRADSL